MRLLEGSVRRKDCIVDGINVGGVLDVLEGECDCHCTTNVKMVGASGAAHQLDLVARLGFETISVSFFQSRTSVLDSFAAEEDSAEMLTVDAIRLGLVSMDCGASLTIMIRLSSFLARDSASEPSESELRDVMDRFNIKLIETPDISTAARKMREILAGANLAKATEIENPA